MSWPPFIFMNPDDLPEILPMVPIGELLPMVASLPGGCSHCHSVPQIFQIVGSQERLAKLLEATHLEAYKSEMGYDDAKK